MPWRKPGRAAKPMPHHRVAPGDLKWPLVSLLLVAVTAAAAMSLLIRLFELAS